MSIRVPKVDFKKYSFVDNNENIVNTNIIHESFPIL